MLKQLKLIPLNKAATENVELRQRDTNPNV
jgi:hypothetical protein